jgi:hypothetical protein
MQILWTTVSQFYDKFASWMNGAFTKLAPEEVENETNESFRWAKAAIRDQGFSVLGFEGCRIYGLHLNIFFEALDSGLLPRRWRTRLTSPSGGLWLQ